MAMDRYELRSVWGIEELQPYGWVVTKDHIDGDKGDVGLMGPGEMDETLTGALHRKVAGRALPDNVQSMFWRMYDDDGELYLEGHLVWPADEQPEESTLVAPLRDYGTPGMGATRLDFHGRPELNVEWC